ncbi:MAG: hypothetical protein GQ527_09345 [Bacteroidales bacterium]|nr:hypothetical protein [Bacteroidales bacterium]
MKNIVKIILTVSLLFWAGLSFSQTPPPPNNGTTDEGGGTPVGGGAPIAGGLLILVTSGLAYATGKYLKKKQLEEESKGV